MQDGWPAIAYEPAAHWMQKVEAFLPVSAFAVPAGQLVHCDRAEAPAVAPKVPLGHAVHVAMEVAGLAEE